jgi:hypothetical protein
MDMFSFQIKTFLFFLGMHGEKNARSLSVPSQSKLTDEISTSTLTELACLPIGCSVSAKYRGAFCTGKC